MGTGQAAVKRCNRRLRDLVIAGRAEPSFVVSRRVALEEAPDAYERFDQRELGYTKVISTPPLRFARARGRPGSRARRVPEVTATPRSPLPGRWDSRGRPCGG